MSRPGGVIGCVFVLVAGLVLGYAGQSAIAIGAPAKVSVSAAVIGSSGGIGSAQPVRVRLQIGVVNTGSAEVQVVDGGADTVTTSIRGLSPADLTVPAGTSGEVALDVAVSCTWPSELTLPTLLVQEPNGEEQSLAVTGASALSEACDRGVPAFRALGVDAVRTEGDRFAMTLQSPTGRLVTIQSVRAGDVPLELVSDDRGAKDSTPAPSVSGPSVSGPSVSGPSVSGPSVSGGSKTTLRLEAPQTCPPEWLIGGLPSTVTADLTDGSSAVLEAGPALPDWLLSTACEPQ